jgi:hypothetical protein
MTFLEFDRLSPLVSSLRSDVPPHNGEGESPLTLSLSCKQGRIEVWVSQPVHDQNVQTARAVGAELDRLLDIAGTRRAGDHVDGARETALAEFAAKPIPDLLIGARDVVGGEDHNVIVGEKIERRWIVGAGMQDEGAGFGDTGEGMRERCFIGKNSPAPAALKGWRALLPGQSLDQRIGAVADGVGEIVGAQEVLDGGGKLIAVL